MSVNIGQCRLYDRNWRNFRSERDLLSKALNRPIPTAQPAPSPKCIKSPLPPCHAEKAPFAPQALHHPWIDRPARALDRVSIILGKREKPIPVTTEKAIRKTIVQTVSATGKIQPEIEVKISPEVAGEIIELPVEDGMAVKKGDLLDEDQTGFLQGAGRAAAGGDQRARRR